MARESREKWLWQKALFVYIQKAVLQNDKKAGLLQPFKDVERQWFCWIMPMANAGGYDGSKQNV